MKDYLVIKVWDSGSYHMTDQLSDLRIEISIDVLTGAFDMDALSFNIKHTYTPAQGDKFYFLPGVTVPRVKLKDLNATYKIRSVRDINEANVFFIGSKTNDVFTDYSWEHRVETEKLKEFIVAAHTKGHIDHYYYQKFLDAVEFYTNEEIIIDYNTRRLVFDKDLGFHISDSNFFGSDKFIKISPEQKELYEQIKDKELYSEESIYEYINGPDAVTIDQNMFEILGDMFKSSDTDNHVLAMEIMANSDYKSSILYLCFLLHDYHPTIENRRERTHVNFKSLLMYMGRTTGNVHLDKDQMVDLMINKKLLTKEYFFEMCNKFKGEIMTYTSNHFKIKTVSSSKVVDEYLNEELIVQIKEDYTSVKEIANISQDEFKNTELDII
jgi:hypothetical protein